MKMIHVHMEPQKQLKMQLLDFFPPLIYLSKLSHSTGTDRVQDKERERETWWIKNKNTNSFMSRFFM